MTGTRGPSPAEQHLGDHLAALVDGELAHDTRERVLAHLATCAKCKAEADAQRQLKSVFATVAPPPPSEGLLARLQGLPGAGGDTGGDAPGGADGGDVSDGRGGPFGAWGGLGGRTTGFAYVPGRGHSAGILAGGRSGGFRIHEVERSAPRGRRFAFAAAGAVSLAALALGGALPLEAAIESPGGRTDGAGAAATPLAPDAADHAGIMTGGSGALAVSESDVSPFLLSAPTGAMPLSPAVSGDPASPLPPYTAPMLPPTATALAPLMGQAGLVGQSAPFGAAPGGGPRTSASAGPTGHSHQAQQASPLADATTPAASRTASTHG